MTKAGTRVKYFQHCQLNQLESTFKIKMCPYKAHAKYKKWTADTQQKQLANFTASLRSRAGDDSLDQSQND